MITFVLITLVIYYVMGFFISSSLVYEKTPKVKTLEKVWHWFVLATVWPLLLII